MRQLAIVGAGGAGALIVHPYDARVAEWAATTEYSSYSPLGDLLGEGWFQATTALGTYAVGRLTKDRTVTHIGSDLIRAQLLNGIITKTLKLTTQRTRPNGGSQSFPSGHSSADVRFRGGLAESFRLEGRRPGVRRRDVHRLGPLSRQLALGE